MKTALHEKDAIISQLQRELAEWPSRHLIASPNNPSLRPVSSSAVFDGKAAGGEHEVLPFHAGQDGEEKVATAPVAKQVSAGLGRGNGEHEAKIVKDTESEESFWLGSHHRLERRNLYESTWLGDEGRDWQSEQESRRDPLPQPSVQSHVSESDRAGMNPLSTPPQRIYHQRFLDGGADRGTASLSRRLRSLAQSAADASIGYDHGEVESRARTTALESNTAAANNYSADSPQGIRCSLL